MLRQLLDYICKQKMRFLCPNLVYTHHSKLPWQLTGKTRHHQRLVMGTYLQMNLRRCLCLTSRCLKLEERNPILNDWKRITLHALNTHFSLIFYKWRMTISFPLEICPIRTWPSSEKILISIHGFPECEKEDQVFYGHYSLGQSKGISKRMQESTRQDYGRRAEGATLYSVAPPSPNYMMNTESSSSSLAPSSIKLLLWGKHSPVQALWCAQRIKIKCFLYGGGGRGRPVVSFSSFTFELKAKHSKAHAEEAI